MYRDRQSAASAIERPSRYVLRYVLCYVPPADSGSLRILRPTAANTAFATAGATGDTGGSPSPDGGAELRTKCTSIAGASRIRSRR